MAQRKPEKTTIARPPARAPSRGQSAKPKLEIDWKGQELRKFPRAKMSMPVSLWIDRDGERVFSASLHCANLSVAGAFLDSTFFLPVGTELRVAFSLEAEDGEPVEARAEIVRQETPNRSGEGRSGFALRFVEFYEKTEVTLARLFLGERLADFAGEYLQSKRAKSLSSELERVVDALAAWELLKVTQPGNVWAPDEIDVP